MVMSAEAYGRQLGQLLPPGAAWTQEPESNLQRLVRALGASLARVHQLSDDLFRETDPRQTYELLDRWEAALGLPDAQVERIYMAGLLHDVGKIGVPESVLQKASKLTDEEFELIKKHPEIGARRYGRARMGELYGGEGWEEVWQLNLPEQQVTSRQYGQSAYGEPYQIWGDTRLECIVSRDKPAGSIVLFSYGGN